MDEDWSLTTSLREGLRAVARAYGLTNIQAIGILEGSERYWMRKGLTGGTRAQTKLWCLH